MNKLIHDNLINYNLTKQEILRELNTMTPQDIKHFETRLESDFKRVEELKKSIELDNVEKVLEALITHKEVTKNKPEYVITTQNKKKLIDTLKQRTDTELLQIKTRAVIGEHNITAEVIDLYNSLDMKQQQIFENILGDEIKKRIESELATDLNAIDNFTIDTLKYNAQDNLKLEEMTFLKRTDLIQRLSTNLDFDSLNEALRLRIKTVQATQTPQATPTTESYFHKVKGALDAIKPVDTILIEHHQSKEQIDTIIKTINPMLFEQIQAFMNVQKQNNKIQENLKNEIDIDILQDEVILEIEAGIEAEENTEIEFCSHNFNTRLFQDSITELINKSIFRGAQTLNIIENRILNQQRIFEATESILDKNNLFLELNPNPTQGIMETFNRIQRFKNKPYYQDAIRAIQNYMGNKILNEVLFEEDSIVENLIIDGYFFKVKQTPKGFDYELITSNVKKDDIEAYDQNPTKTIKEEFSS